MRGPDHRGGGDCQDGILAPRQLCAAYGEGKNQPRLGRTARLVSSRTEGDSARRCLCSLRDHLNELSGRQASIPMTFRGLLAIGVQRFAREHGERCDVSQGECARQAPASMFRLHPASGKRGGECRKTTGLRFICRDREICRPFVTSAALAT